MTNSLKIFEKERFPIIKVYDTHFEIKATDHWRFRKFDFEKVDSLVYYNPENRWYNNTILVSFWHRFFRNLEPSILKIKLKNGGDWKYNCPHKIDGELNKFLFYLNSEIQVHNL